MKVILASGSPRRHELLKRIYNDFEIVLSNVNEREIESKIEKENSTLNKLELSKVLSMELSKVKALDVFNSIGREKDTLVIGADTSVALFDEILGKPQSKEDAIRMLKKESMYPQYVITGVTLVYNDIVKTFYESTKVIFKELDKDQEKRIIDYCNTPDPYDKAGAYGIQDESDDMVKCYIGEYENIVGFPIKKVKEELKKLQLL